MGEDNINKVLELSCRFLFSTVTLFKSYENLREYERKFNT